MSTIDHSLQDYEVTSYLRVQNTLDQEECPICYSEFGRNAKIIKLACNHLIDQSCFSPAYIDCPVCHTLIQSRVKQYSKDEINHLMRGISQTVLEIRKTTHAPFTLDDLTEAFEKFLLSDVPIHSKRFYISFFKECSSLMPLIARIVAEGEKNLFETAALRLFPYMINFIHDIDLQVQKDLIPNEEEKAKLYEKYCSLFPQILSQMLAIILGKDFEVTFSKDILSFFNKVFKYYAHNTKVQNILEHSNSTFIQLLNEALAVKIKELSY